MAGWVSNNMYDDTHWWYVEMEKERLKERLAHLSLQQLVVYSVGCVTHANQVIIADVQSPELADFQHSTLLLRLFWEHYPQAVTGGPLASTATTAEEVVASVLGPVPDEKFLQASGAEPLLWATLYALTLATNARPVVSAYSALDSAYRGIYARFARDKRAINEGRMHEVEQATAECVAELRFQVNYLEMLEQSPLLPSSYVAVSACSDPS